jgi:hypothetical protein
VVTGSSPSSIAPARRWTGQSISEVTTSTAFADLAGRPEGSRGRCRADRLNRFPTTRDAFQATNAGALDLAIVQLNRRGRLLFSSYFGSSGEEDSTGVPPALDPRGNLYISGITTSPDFPVTPEAIQPTYGGGDIDGIVVKAALPR